MENWISKNNKVWDFLFEKYNIVEEVNKNGFFVGQLFGDRDDWNKNKNINTFSKEQIIEYLKPYKIIKLEEIEYIRKKDNKNGTILI